MATSVYKNGDVVSGAVLTGLGIYVILEARGWDYLAPDGPGPGFFPIWYGVALLALSLFLVIGALARRTGEPVERIRWNEVGRALFAWVGLAAAIAALKPLGFALSFALLTLFVVSFMYRRPVLHGIVAGIAGSALFYLLFPLALNVALPVGDFGF